MEIDSFKKVRGKEPVVISLDSDDEDQQLSIPRQPPNIVKTEHKESVVPTPQHTIIAEQPAHQNEEEG
jgi:hypothetical protein